MNKEAKKGKTTKNKIDYEKYFLKIRDKIGWAEINAKNKEFDNQKYNSEIIFE